MPSSEPGATDDVSPYSDGTASVLFDRDAESLGDAIGSAIKNVERAGLTVARVEVELVSDCPAMAVWGTSAVRVLENHAARIR